MSRRADATVACLQSRSAEITPRLFLSRFQLKSRLGFRKECSSFAKGGKLFSPSHPTVRPDCHRPRMVRNSFRRFGCARTKEMQNHSSFIFHRTRWKYCSPESPGCESHFLYFTFKDSFMCKYNIKAKPDRARGCSDFPDSIWTNSIFEFIFFFFFICSIAIDSR